MHRLMHNKAKDGEILLYIRKAPHGCTNRYVYVDASACFNAGGCACPCASSNLMRLMSSACFNAGACACPCVVVGAVSTSASAEATLWV